MPRKKTVQPEPIEVHPFDEFILEIFDVSLPIGRGLHNRYQADERRNRALRRLAELHRSTKKSDHRTLDDYMGNISSLVTWLERTEESGEKRAFWRTAKQAVAIYKGILHLLKKRGQS